MVRINEQHSDLVDVFVSNRNQLYLVAYKILGSKAKAEDVVQDAYLKITDSNMLSGVIRPLAYVQQVVRNLAIDRYRRISFEANFFDEMEEGLTVPSHATPEKISIDQQSLKIVADALQGLPDRTRQAFELYRLKECSQKEIADLLGVSPTLINFMIKDALNHCRLALQKTD